MKCRDAESLIATNHHKRQTVTASCKGKREHMLLHSFSMDLSLNVTDFELRIPMHSAYKYQLLTKISPRKSNLNKPYDCMTSKRSASPWNLQEEFKDPDYSCKKQFRRLSISAGKWTQAEGPEG